MNEIFNILKDLISQVRNLSPELTFILVLLGVGYGLKKSLRVNNDRIPWILAVISFIAYPLVSERPSPEEYQKFYSPLFISSLKGLLIWMIAWFFHEKIFKRFIDSKLEKSGFLPLQDDSGKKSYPSKEK